MSNSTAIKSDAALSERLATSLFRSLCAYDRWRLAHPACSHVVNALITMAVAAALYTVLFVLWRVVEAIAAGSNVVTFTIPPKWTPLDKFDYIKLSCSLTAGFFFNRTFLNGLLPTFPFAQQSIAMRQLGLDLISHDDFAHVVEQYLPKHDITQRIRVTCMSGAYLFRDVGGPLHKAAKDGKLHVVMPMPEAVSPTLSARYRTFDKGFKLSKNLRTLDQFLVEVEGGAEFLMSIGGNDVVYHQLLCIWRTVLLSSHCIVQAYFPNKREFAEQRGPVFVFAKRPEGRGAYYEIFDQMFKLLNDYGSPARPN